MVDRTTTIGALIKNLNMMPDKTAQVCGQIFSQLGAKVQAHDDAIFGDMFQEAVSSLHFAAMELETMRSVFKANDYVTKRDFRVSCIKFGIIGGIIGAVATIAAWSYYG